MEQTQRETIGKQIGNRPSPERFAEGLEDLRQGVRDMVNGVFTMDTHGLADPNLRSLPTHDVAKHR